ncbi:unnamed protein product [Rotaria sp. Silwood1]|nr:unnamed protein product [Rotaria sp. Silwood1]
MADDSNKSVQPIDSSNKTSGNNFNELLLPDDAATSIETVVPSTPTTTTAGKYIQLSNKHIYSVNYSALNVEILPSNSNNASTISDNNAGKVPSDRNNKTVQEPSQTPDQSPVQACSKAINSQQKQRHIMISYHRKSSLDICEKICNRLKDLNYKVWMDKNNLHGGIHEAMARAIENCFVVLVCFNHEYCDSYYCKREVLYTVNKHIKFIPCLMEASFKPEGSIGIAIRINEITPTHLNTIISDCQELFGMSDNDLQALTKDELIQRITRLRQQHFSDTTSLRKPSNNNSHQQEVINNQQILQELLIQSRNQTEFLKNINRVLTNLISPSTIAKLSLFIMFLYTLLNLSNISETFWS